MTGRKQHRDGVGPYMEASPDGRQGKESRLSQHRRSPSQRARDTAYLKWSTGNVTRGGRCAPWTSQAGSSVFPECQLGVSSRGQANVGKASKGRRARINPMQAVLRIFTDCTLKSDAPNASAGCCQVTHSRLVVHRWSERDKQRHATVELPGAAPLPGKVWNQSKIGTNSCALRREQHANIRTSEHPRASSKRGHFGNTLAHPAFLR